MKHSRYQLRPRRSKQELKTRRRKQAFDIFYILFCVLVFSGIGYKFQHLPHIILSPIAKAQQATKPTPSVSVAQLNEPLIVVDSNTNPTQEEIEGYIRRIFTQDPDTAVAVSRAECPPQNKKYPYCVLHTDAEYSVGAFQINLYNKEQKIHADRIPGTTMEEKIEWLKNPFNNTLYAYWVFSTSGWNPWSTYTSGKYAANL